LLLARLPKLPECLRSLPPPATGGVPTKNCTLGGVKLTGGAGEELGEVQGAVGMAGGLVFGSGGGVGDRGETTLRLDEAELRLADELERCNPLFC
jgi:hypothetical protein